MSKKRTFIKWSLITISSLIIIVVLFGVWFMNLLPPLPESAKNIKKSLPSELTYLTENIIPNRGKILTVVTSTDSMGSSGKSTGYELTELSRAYYVFQANGYDVDVASPLGGLPPVVLDGDDMKEFDYAFLNDAIAQSKVTNSIAVEDIDPMDYKAVYFVGGKGAMFDFPDNVYIQTIIKELYEADGVVGAVCHGPAALVNVKLSNGESILSNNKISSFTNEEELLLIPNAPEIFPFLLQNKLTENGAQFNEGSLYLNKVSKSGNLVTGQNPWSTWELAESMIKQLGHEPKSRKITAEENSITILGVYQEGGLEKAKNTIEKFSKDNIQIDREIIAIHSLLAAYQFELGKFVNLIQLLRYSNTLL